MEMFKYKAHDSDDTLYGKNGKPLTPNTKMNLMKKKNIENALKEAES